MIDRKTGDIIISATCQLKARAAFDAVFALSLGEVQELVDRQNGWKWLTIKNLKVDEDYFILSLGFRANALTLVELIISKTRFKLTANWDSWSEQNELEILKELRVWLIRELGHEEKFAWGTVQATYDPKGGSSSISIQYS